MYHSITSNKVDHHTYFTAIALKISVALVLIMYMLIPLVHASPYKQGKYPFHFGKRYIEVDIVENPRKFSFDETPVFADGLPAYGGEFITQGIIYPKGTLEMGNGVDADGNPEFPDLVIGTWICRGWHIGDGAHTQTGPAVITHQLFNFGKKFGLKTITTDGVELADVDEPVKRAITGGTGPYRYARGEQIQTFKGMSQYESEQGPLFSFRFRMKLKVR